MTGGEIRSPHPGYVGFAADRRQNHPPTRMAASMPISWAAMNAGTPAGAIPANVSDSERAIVTAGLANDVEAVNQYAEVM